jgi:phosphoheptose isomerase
MMNWPSQAQEPDVMVEKACISTIRYDQHIDQIVIRQHTVVESQGSTLTGIASAGIQ